MCTSISPISTTPRNELQYKILDLYHLATEDQNEYMNRVDSILQQFEKAYVNFTNASDSIIKKRITERLKFLKISLHPLDVIENIYDIVIAIKFLDIDCQTLSYPFDHFQRILEKELFIPFSTVIDTLAKLKKASEINILLNKTQKKLLLEGLLQRTDKHLLNLKNRIKLQEIFSPKDELKNKVSKFIKELSTAEFKDLSHLTITNLEDLALVDLYPSLTSLDLLFPSTLKNDKMAKKIFKALADLKLKHLKIQNTEIEGRDLATFTLMPLKSLTLTGIPLQDDAIEKINQITTLRKLDVSDTSVTDLGLMNLSNTELTHLSIGVNNEITPTGIQSCLKKLKLEYLNIAWTDSLKHGMTEILPSIIKMPKLNSLDLRGAHLSYEQLMSLSALPLKNIDLRQGLDFIEQNSFTENQLLEFAGTIRMLHNIYITIKTGSVLDWKELKLNEIDGLNPLHASKKNLDLPKENHVIRAIPFYQ
ncbi:MAG: hypothetical protein H0U27_10565 [Nitrosopumilus sp.]|nr:hypothetical protein [Nitrosopumilus sp.]